ncbi:Mu transposase C-terminal domain-containing protein [Ruegeria sp.]|uniref:Mu transposase C-terminal domain-containing protein n=1 Tax=Ruegeria sp. TaxID=1879320 RepID=UPI003B00AC47
MRLDAVAASERLIATGIARADADARAAKGAGVTGDTVRRWRLTCQGLAPEARLVVLTDRPGRGRCGPLSDAQMRDCALALIHEHGPHLTASHVVRVLKARYGKTPSLRATQRWLKTWRGDAENARALSAVSDPDGHRARLAPALGCAAAEVRAPNALWELDSTPADVICTDGRHTIVGAIDVWARRAKVLVVPTSRATAICALLRRCLVDWGVPEVARTDEGRDYTSRHLTRVLSDLGIQHDICPPYTPEAKPYIERFFGTMTRDLFAFLPGFTGHDVMDRKKLEAKKSMSQRRGTDAAETFDIALSGAELQRKCDIWVEAIYGRRAHGGTGESPFQRMAAWPGDPDRPLRRIGDPRALDPLLAEPVSRSGDGPRRTISKQGLSVGGIWYIAPEMGTRVGERVELRYDPADPARLFVFSPEGRFLFMAEDPARTGADLTRIAAQAKTRARKADSAARKDARDLARAHNPKGAMEDVLSAGEAAAGKVIAFSSVGPRSGARADQPHETPALKEAGKAAEARAGAGGSASSAAPKASRRTAGGAGGASPALEAAAKLFLDEGI